MIGKTSDRRFDVGIALLRSAIGAVFIAHGGQKLFVYGPAGVSGAFGQMGVPLPGVTGPAVALLEFFGGIALILGLATRLAAAGLAVNMLGAMFLVHLAAGFFLPGGVEFTLTLFAASFALALTGAGAFSLDAVLGRGRPGATG
jgi:putative oxidoreductase